MSTLTQKIYAAVQNEWTSQVANFTGNKQQDDLFRFKVLAAIVAQNTVADTFQVLTLATGTKSIVDSSLAGSGNGTVILDAHAEVMVRRALKRFLIAEMKSLPNSRFLESRSNGGCRLKDNMKLHLFISRAPCGSAQKPFTSRKATSLRVFTCESEADPVAEQTTRPDNRQFYTCSDKLTMWTVAGLQGGLLGRYLEPIYLESVVIRCNTAEELKSLERALTGRIQGTQLEAALKTRLGAIGSSKTKQFNLHAPQSLGISVSDETFYQTWTGNKAKTESSSLSHNWVRSQGWEFVDTRNGKVHVLNDPSADQREKVASRLSKKSLLDQLRGPSGYSKSYYAVKQEDSEYQNAKKAVRDTFQSLGLGIWVKRNAQFENFH